MVPSSPSAPPTPIPPSSTSGDDQSLVRARGARQDPCANGDACRHGTGWHPDMLSGMAAPVERHLVAGLPPSVPPAPPSAPGRAPVALLVVRGWAGCCGHDVLPLSSNDPGGAPMWCVKRLRVAVSMAVGRRVRRCGSWRAGSGCGGGPGRGRPGPRRFALVAFALVLGPGRRGRSAARRRLTGTWRA